MIDQTEMILDHFPGNDFLLYLAQAWLITIVIP